MKNLQKGLKNALLFLGIVFIIAGGIKAIPFIYPLILSALIDPFLIISIGIAFLIIRKSL